VTIVDRFRIRRVEHFAPANQYRLMVEAFAGAVPAGEPVPYAPEESVANMRALDALAHAVARNDLQELD
jgi:D-xylose 1-dehydrogenase (NADP+, D-xylono-1,5-lactone-forming)